MVLQKHFSYASVVKDIDVAGYLWEPEEQTPRALLVISHGMTESMVRYDDFANYMANRGVLVAGKDHLGHGRTARSADELGYFGPIEYNNVQNADFHKLVNLVRAMHPGVPLFVMGHSMGSFLVREYITEHGEELSGAVLSGPGDMNRFTVSMGRALVDMMSLFKGKMYRSNLVQNIMFGKFNSHIPHHRTQFDWLTRDDAVVDEYLKHKENGFVFTLNGFAHMLLNVARVSQPQAFSEVPSTLPLLLVGGGQDPVGDWGKALPSLGAKYRKGGVEDVTVKLYKDDRHEVISELDKDVVDADILAWMESHLNG